VAVRYVGPEEARIFDAHLMLLGDAEVLADVKSRISSGAGAAAAWVDALAVVERQWSELPDPTCGHAQRTCGRWGRRFWARSPAQGP
jgi:multiphosphoryl transfer protein